MLLKNRCFFTAFLAFIVCLILPACGISQSEGPTLGAPSMGSPMDKSGDAQLQTLIAEIAPKFSQGKFQDGDITLNYNLFVPEKIEKGKKYPLVLFIADASTVGANTATPLTQGYGALVFASPESQKANPCFVLVPQFSGVAVNDAYQRTPEVATALALLKKVAADNPVDQLRIYSTGQSMGGMISMFYDIENPGIFAASMFVDSHWDTTGFDRLVETPFIFFYAGENGKAFKMRDAIENAARHMGKSYTWSEWSARLPLAQQDELAKVMLSKGQPINIIGFENGTVLPEGVSGSEHMYSFDHAYQIAPARDWLFRQSLKKSGL